MKEQKKKSRISKVYRPLITVFVGIATAVLASFTALQLTTVTQQKHAQTVEANRQAVQNGPVVPGTPNGLPPYTEGHTPSYIYHLGTSAVTNMVPSVSQPAVQNAGDFVAQYVWGLSRYGLLVDDVLDVYQDALVNIMAVNGFSAIDSMVAEAQQQSRNFHDRSTVFSNYQNLNKFGKLDTSKEIFITKPGAIYDVYSHGATGEPNVELSTDDFAYKVATVNFDTLKDKKSLSFKFRDLGDPDNADHDYRIVISNQNNEIENFVNGTAPFTPTSTLEDLVKSGVIFVRDISEASPAAAPNPSSTLATSTLETLSKVKLYYDPSSKMLNFLILPDDTNSDDAHAIKFGVDKDNSDKDALAAITYGILDNSHSPLHTKQYATLSTTGFQTPGDPLDINAPMIPASVDPTNIVSSLPIHALYGKYTNSDGSTPVHRTDYNTIQLFMAKGTTVEHQLRFENQSGDAFDGGANNLTINYSESDVVDVNPNRFTIKAEKAAGSTAGLGRPVIVESELLGTDPARFAQVFINLPKNSMQINPVVGHLDWEQNYRIKNVTDRIFFEIPGGVQFDEPNNKKEINLETKTEVTDKDLELIGDLYRNWSGPTVEKPTLENGNTNPAYIKQNANLVWDYVAAGQANPAQTFPGNKLPGTDGYATFGKEAANPYGSADYVIQFPHLTETEQGGVKTLGTQNGIILMDVKGIRPGDTDSSDDTWQPMYHDANGDLQFATDESQYEYIPANGWTVTNLFVEYTNMLSRWAIEKLGLPETQVRAEDEYKLTDPSGSIGFVKARIIDRSGADGIRLQQYANALARSWMDANMTQDELDIITDLNSQFVPLGIDINRDIRAKGKPDGQGNVDMTNPDYLSSRQMIYMILQPYLVAAMNAIILVEYDAFQSKQNIALGTYVHQYLAYSNDDADSEVNGKGVHSIGIPQDIIINVVPKDPSLANLKLLAVGNYSVIETSNGLEELTSLLDFIKLADLQNKYLSPAEVVSFNTFMENYDFADETLFTDPANQSPLEDFLIVLSKIIGNIVDDVEGVMTLQEIVEKISNQEYDLQADPDGPRNDIQASIQAAIRKIATNQVYGSLSFMGSEAEVSYLQSLVMGKNVYEIFNEYILVNNAKLTDDQKKSLEDFRDKSTYNMAELSRLAINLGYYNLPFFIKQLTEEGRVEGMANDMLHSDLSKDIRLTIDTDNQLIKFVTDSDSLTKYAFMAIGVGTFAMGAAIFGLSFRKSIRFTSKKSALTERFIFASIALIGAILAALSFIPGLM